MSNNFSSLYIWGKDENEEVDLFSYSSITEILQKSKTEYIYFYYLGFGICSGDRSKKWKNIIIFQIKKWKNIIKERRRKTGHTPVDGRTDRADIASKNSSRTLTSCPYQ